MVLEIKAMVIISIHSPEWARREGEMPLYIAQGRFTRDAVKGMLQTPEDRTESVARLFESLGGRLISWYMTTGEYDWMVISEAPDAESSMAAGVAAMGGGGVTDVKTCLALDGPAAKAVFARAQEAARNFKSAGQAGSGSAAY